ncbi:hypothetical protein HN954_01640 [bacterium]|jgi:hypothetical protein|nr:hypothetical protein [bacterium]MBT6831977.1 hypothetical protein [bacterium]MBT6996112.1 hypothetical protein [bacterium]MBT7772647.1 hypothetical protein [bacterium]
MKIEKLTFNANGEREIEEKIRNENPEANVKTFSQEIIVPVGTEIIDFSAMGYRNWKMILPGKKIAIHFCLAFLAENVVIYKEGLKDGIQILFSGKYSDETETDKSLVRDPNENWGVLITADGEIEFDQKLVEISFNLNGTEDIEVNYRKVFEDLVFPKFFQKIVIPKDCRVSLELSKSEFGPCWEFLNPDNVCICELWLCFESYLRIKHQSVTEPFFMCFPGKKISTVNNLLKNPLKNLRLKITESYFSYQEN